VLLASSSDDDSEDTSVLLANICKKPALKDPPCPIDISVATVAVKPKPTKMNDIDDEESVNLLDPETQDGSVNELVLETQDVTVQPTPSIASVASIPSIATHASINPFVPINHGLSLPGNLPFTLNAFSQQNMSQLTQHSAFVPNNQWNNSIDPLCRGLSEQQQQQLLMTAYNGNAHGFNYGQNPLPGFGTYNNNNNYNTTNNYNKNILK
jgi:hypothetical protein